MYKRQEQVVEFINENQPEAIFNAAGITGKPNVDWCEDHPVENMKGNTILPLMIAEACQQTGTYMLHLGTGCIFYGASPHADGIWNENDYGNPVATYSRAKYAADLVLTTCLLYTSDAADDSLRVDLGGRRIIKKIVDGAVPRRIDTRSHPITR